MKNQQQNMIIVSDFLRSYMLTVLLEKCTYIQIKDTLHIIFQTNDIDICRRPYTFNYKVLKLHLYSLPV